MKYKKRAILIGSILVIIGITGLVAWKLVQRYSKSYNDWVDRKNYEELCAVLVSDDVDRIYFCKPYQYLPDQTIPSVFHPVTNQDVFKTLEYRGSAWNTGTAPYNSVYSVRVWLKSHGDEIELSTEGTDQFRVYYKERLFYVSSPELYQSISDTLGWIR